jgi:2-epi-5-epi-valiolone synthase
VLTSRADKKNLKTWQVRQTRAIQYDVRETFDVLDPANLSLLMGGTDSARRFVLVDDEVFKTREERIRAYFKHHNVQATIVPIHSTETNKSFDLFFKISRELDKFRLNRRNEPIIVIGGGVLMDVVCFVASTYRRGVPCIRVPTTLMGCIDASVGIKTAVNFDHNKNRVGSFEAPYAVFVDRSFLTTLSQRHMVNGVGEIMKLAQIRDAKLFELLESQGKDAIAEGFQTKGNEIFQRAIEGMLEELEPNLFEVNLERPSDYGHTFSLALEMEDVENLLHGEAVAIDCAFTTVLAEQRGFINLQLCDRVLDCMLLLGLPIWHEKATAQMFWESLVERTAHRDGHQRVPVMKGLGECRFVNDFTQAEIAHGMKVWEERCKSRDLAQANARAIEARAGQRRTMTQSAALDESWGET